MVIQTWLIAGLIAGGLAGIMMARSYGITGDIVLGIIGGLAGGSLASILFVVSGAANEMNVTGIVVALGAMILMLIIGRFAHSRFSSRYDDRGDASLPY
jgi:uncharacterized membrane protein YeaQ/YmgE (transglycosylase-associated protein family)